MKAILGFICFLISMILILLTRIYQWNHDSITEIQLFKMFWLLYLIAIMMLIIMVILYKSDKWKP